MRSTGVLATSNAALARGQGARRRLEALAGSTRHDGIAVQLARVFGEHSHMTEPVPKRESMPPRPDVRRGVQARSNFCPYCALANLFLSRMRPTELVAWPTVLPVVPRR
jgi:hypothetical protein